MNTRKKDCDNSDLKGLMAANSPLPVLSKKNLDLLRSLSGQEKGIEDISRIIEHYPSIVARLIYLANSAWSAPSAPISNTLDACTRLGVNTVKSVSIGLVVSSPFNPSQCPSFDILRYWASALLMVEAVDQLIPCLKESKGLDSAAVRTAALLSNLGVLCMADRLPYQAQAAFEMVESGVFSTLLDAQKKCSGTDYCEVGGCIAETWGLPSPLPECMAHHRDVDYRGTGSLTVSLVKSAHAIVSNGFLQDRCETTLDYPAELGIGPRDGKRIETQVYSRVPRMQEFAKELV